MPRRPPHACASPGCPALVEDGARCADHARALQAEIDSFRPSAARRGYGAAWRRIRLDHLRRNPLCVLCLAETGRSVPAEQVDHIRPLRAGGTHAPGNLRSLCAPHHSRVTNQFDGGFGRPRRSKA